MTLLKPLDGHCFIDPIKFSALEQILKKTYRLTQRTTYLVRDASYCNYNGNWVGVGFIEHGLTPNGKKFDSVIVAQKEIFDTLIGRNNLYELEYNLIHNSGDVMFNYLVPNEKMGINLSLTISPNLKDASKEYISNLIKARVAKLGKLSETLPKHADVIQLALNSAKLYNQQIERRFL